MPLPQPTRGHTQASVAKLFEVESIGHAVCNLPESCCSIRLDHVTKHT